MQRGTIDEIAKERVKEILQKVKERKLEAILECTEKFDGIKLDKGGIKVSEDEIKNAYNKLTKKQLTAIRESIKRVKIFHLKQKKAIQNITLKSKEGTTTLRWLPLEQAGIYAPAGKAPLPSSVLMAAIPAKIAGVKELVLCSPPQKDGNVDASILVVANECGINNIYKIGGAQAIGAMAYGCELFDSVDIIAGPGNVYTSYAKQLVASLGAVKIDTIAGPSEVLVLADETGSPSMIASDMLAQAEHGSNSSAICITTSEKIANQVAAELKLQVNALKDNSEIKASLANFGAVVLCETLEQAIDFVNIFAPEHAEIYTKNADAIAAKIINAGAVFIGTGEVFGDYGMSDSNHILPTGRAARFASGVSVYTFLKYQLVEKMNPAEQKNLAPLAAEFARLERLEAHARSAEQRSKEVKK